MKNLIFIISLLFLLGCSTVPLTNRKQFTAIPSSEMIALSRENYQQVLNEQSRSSNRRDVQAINRVGQQVSAAVENYLKKIGRSDLLNGYEWEFNLLEGDIENAWCMPGGKIAFYEGIMPICRDENGIAVVMSHEIAHAIAKHGNERMSQEMALQMGGMALSQALAEKKESTQEIAMLAFGVGSQLGIILPYSRSHENEADELGLYFMAMAGFDPREAPKFWERMIQHSQSAGMPEFLSTHPNPQNRINHLTRIMPKAMKFYN